MTKRVFILILSLFYRPREDKYYMLIEGKKACSVCGKKTKRGVRGIRGPNRGKVFCVLCYLYEIPGKVDRVLAKLCIPLMIIVLSLTIVIGVVIIAWPYHPFSNTKQSIIPYEFGNELKIDDTAKEKIVGYFYVFLTTVAKRDNVSRGQIRIQVEAALKTRFPLLMLAIIYRESLFDPGALGEWVTVDYKGKKIKVQARGNTQVLPTWTERLVAEGIIEEERDLHDPVLGVRAGEFIFCQHLIEQKGDILMATKEFVGSSKPDPLNVKYVRDVFETYGELRLLLMSMKKEERS
jgi:hypothetical protein